MLTYHTYNKEKDVLKVGTNIRLAGRTGRIFEKDSPTHFLVHWDDDKYVVEGNFLGSFPLLEIADEPLTISKRLKEEIKAQLKTINPYEKVEFENFEYIRLLCRAERDLIKWLDSLEETE